MLKDDIYLFPYITYFLSHGRFHSKITKVSHLTESKWENSMQYKYLLQVSVSAYSVRIFLGHR